MPFVDKGTSETWELEETNVRALVANDTITSERYMYTKPWKKIGDSKIRN
jgi:hypothetical protein